MPRPLRIHYPHACYHVMNRGAGRQRIFINDLHRSIFIELLQDCKKLFNIKIYAYCLMDNHYHILLSTPDANLSRVMRHLNGVYTQKYNRLMKRDGSLFRGRYHAKIVDEDCYRLLVTRYIHLNPVEAGIVENPAHYRWSSYQAYLGLTTKLDWLSIDSIIEQFHQTTALTHVKNYQDYVEGKNLDEISDYKSLKHTSPIVGSMLFKENIINQIHPTYIEPCSTDINRLKSQPSIEFILDFVCSFYRINHETLIKGKKGRLNTHKLIFIYICKNEFGLKLRIITPFVGFSRYESTSAAVQKCKKELRYSKDLSNEVSILTSKIKEALLKRD